MAKTIRDYPFRYRGFMSGAMQSLPIGNGDIGANIWLSEDGRVHFLLSKTDAWSELYRLLKTAHVVLTADPCPFSDGAEFELSMADGLLTISAGGAVLRVYADANAPCVRMRFEMETPADVDLRFDNYRSQPIDPGDDDSNYFIRWLDCGVVESADAVLHTPGGGVAQIHRNNGSSWRAALRNQDLESWEEKAPDPLDGRTFGTAVYSAGMRAGEDGLFAKGTREAEVSLYVGSGFSPSAEAFCPVLDGMYDRNGGWSEEKLEKHAESWRAFWERAYIYAEGDPDAEQITRAFLCQRYMTRCADRGAAPMKFNGLLFTADEMKGRPGNYDARKWGAPYWIQNTRIMYWFLLAMGDYASVTPMLDMYLDMMPIAEERCRQHFGHAGMLIPETATSFGLYANSNYGIKDENGVRAGEGGVALRRGEPCNRYIRYHFNGMLELSFLMLRYLDESGDDTERRGRIFRFIEQTLLFFDRHFDRWDGKLVMTPVSALETWQLCVNDAPDTAGLTAVCENLLNRDDLPESLAALAKDLAPAVPPLPLTDTENGPVLAPCEIKIVKVPHNSENPELYAVFPFDLFGPGRPGLEIARETYRQRANRLDGGWSQDPLDAALLGLTDEAAAHLIRQTGPAAVDERALFPAFWGPNFDETPDQDHGCMTALSLIRMLLQPRSGDERFAAFPAWPEKWDVRFRLPLDHTLCVSGQQTKGCRTVRTEPF